MTLVSGPLSTVTTTPSAVPQVNISINSPRTRGTGVMTPEVKTVTVAGGVFSSQIAPGPAVLTLLIGGRETVPIPILVDDIPSQTLANAVNAAKVATSDNREWLEKLAAAVIAGTQGPMGDPGISPHVQDETWWVGDTDTGIHAQGPKGDPGDKGDPGPTGSLDLIDESVQTTIDTVVIPAIEDARDEALGQVGGAVAAEVGNTTHHIATGTNVHAGKVVRLNTEGRLVIATGSVIIPTDPANKAYVDSADNKKADLVHKHSGSDIVSGTTWDVNYTDDRFADQLVRLNPSGKIVIHTEGITSPTDPANKAYVDTAVNAAAARTTSWWN